MIANGRQNKMVSMRILPRNTISRSSCPDKQSLPQVRNAVAMTTSVPLTRYQRTSGRSFLNSLKEVSKFVGMVFFSRMETDLYFAFLLEAPARFRVPGLLFFSGEFTSALYEFLWRSPDDQ